MFDVFVCPDCDNFRNMPATDVSDNKGNSSHAINSDTLTDTQLLTSAESVGEEEKAYVKSELLCFIQNKINTIAVDQLVLVCVDFYK